MGKYVTGVILDLQATIVSSGEDISKRYRPLVKAIQDARNVVVKLHTESTQRHREVKDLEQAQADHERKKGKPNKKVSKQLSKCKARLEALSDELSDAQVDYKGET